MIKIERWKQRFQNFQKAFKHLEDTLKIKNPSEAERAGLIQFYELSFELAWKTLKDFIEKEGLDVKSPRETLKTAHQLGYIQQTELWLAALESRNLTTHLYDESSAELIETEIRTKYFDLLAKLSLFFLKQG